MSASLSVCCPTEVQGSACNRLGTHLHDESLVTEARCETHHAHVAGLGDEVLYAMVHTLHNKTFQHSLQAHLSEILYLIMSDALKSAPAFRSAVRIHSLSLSLCLSVSVCVSVSLSCIHTHTHTHTLATHIIGTYTPPPPSPTHTMATSNTPSLKEKWDKRIYLSEIAQTK